MGERILEAWHEGTLVLPLQHSGEPVQLPGQHRDAPLPTALTGSAHVRQLGAGERFVAWLLEPEENAPLVVRIPHVAPGELTQALSREIAALTVIPAGVGPSAVAVHDQAEHSPLGLPYAVVSYLPGRVLAPSAWTPQHVLAHARRLAQLHTVLAPARGPVTPGPDPWSEVPPGGQDLLTEVEQLVSQWRDEHADVIARADLDPLLDAVLDRVAQIAPQVSALESVSLTHGDLCATNILWPQTPSAPEVPVGPVFIDFEWAQADDPARDLAILGGSVHGGPWYVPMTDDQVKAFVHEYARERAQLGPAPDALVDPDALRERMRAWTAYERGAMLVHIAACVSEQGRHQQVLPVLRDTLARELGV